MRPEVVLGSLSRSVAGGFAALCSHRVHLNDPVGRMCGITSTHIGFNLIVLTQTLTTHVTWREGS